MRWSCRKEAKPIPPKQEIIIRTKSTGYLSASVVAI